MRNSIFTNEKNKFLSVFFAAFFLITIYYFNIESMIGESGDATDVWNTIVSYYSGDVYPSYVLYKGFLAVYPYVWFYRISEMFNLDAFIFVKIYYAACFLYITLIGFPYVISFLSNRPINYFKHLVLFATLFFLWEYTKVLSQFMIDLPNLTYFMIGVNLVIFIYRNLNKSKWYHFILAGLFLSSSSTLTGQYIVASILLIIVVMIVILKGYNNYKNRFGAVLLIVIGIMLPILVNQAFETNVVNPMRSEGAWIPTAEDWAKHTSIACIKEYMTITDQMDSPRGEAIIYNYAGADAEWIIEKIDNGGIVYDKWDYVKMFYAHPLDFIIIWMNKLFLLLSFDDGNLNVLHLFISYSSIFICLNAVFRNVGKLSKMESLIVIAFILTALPVSLAQVENRYGIALYGLLIAYLVLGINFKFSKHKDRLNFTTLRKINNQVSIGVKQCLLLYVIFMMFCFMHMGVLYELSSRSSILFKFWY